MDPLDFTRDRLGQLADPIALLAGIFVHAPFGLQVYEADGHCLLVNEAFRQMFGSAPPEGYNVLQDEIAARNGVLDLVHRAFAGEVITLPPMWYDPRELQQVKVPENEGRRAAIAATFIPLRDAKGAVSHVGIVFKDLTNELLSRQQAEAERDLLRAIIEQSGDGIIVCDQEGIVHGMNPEAERQHGAGHRGVPAEDWARAFGLFDMEGRGLPLEDTPLYRALRGERVEDARWRVRRPDGAERILSGTASPLRRADGSSAGAVLSTRDETDRLSLEDQLRRESAQKDRLYQEAHELNRLKDEFLATMSHELRTPLQAILGWARLLRESGLEQARLERGLDTIERNARLQVQLVEEILDASRVVTGKMRLEWRAVSMDDVLQAALDTARPMAEAKGVSLSAQFARAPLTAMGDAERLQQVFWNLVSNAVKFTPRGGHVKVALRSEAEAAVVTVEDDGAGITADFLPHVFDRFRQADSSTTRAHGGLGLGLAIVKHLTELHGGTVEAHSAGAGRGARFVVRLPVRLQMIHPTVAARPPADPAAPPPRLDGLRVLVVDDEEDTRELLGIVLRTQGALVTQAASVREALAALADGLVDVLVSDIGMPGEDGYSLMGQVRALPAEHGARVPSVALTAYAREEDRRKALAAGFQRHLPKPIEPGELIRIVASVSSRR
jgi:PAS domain S-box-containing protein